MSSLGGMFRFEEFPSPTAYLGAVEGELCRDECLHSVAIGVAQKAAKDEAQGEWGGVSALPDRDLFGAVWREDGQLDLAVWRTGPHVMGLSGGTDEGIAFLVGEFRDRGIRIQGANCALEASETLAREIHAQDGRCMDVLMEQRLFRLTTVTPPAPVPGVMLNATWDDVEIVRHWAHRFGVDCGLLDLQTEPEERPSILVRGGVRLWALDGEPVAMAGSMRQSPRGASISWVYTPDVHRGRGYASNLVAALSQHFLDHGKDFCCLFTDKANPTSNKIYQAMGYRPVIDFRRVRFA